ncbi:MAG: OmpA family protein [Acetobacteraceae bacterium]
MRHFFTFVAVLGLAGLAFVTVPAHAAEQRFVVFFQEWSAGLDKAALQTIAVAARAAAEDPGAKISVTGYADLLGSVQANLYLTETRAQVVTDQLKSDGVAAPRITQHSAGQVPYQLTSQESRRTIITVGGP